MPKTWAATILRTDRKEMGTSAPHWRLTVPTTTKMMLVRPLMTSLKMTVRDDYTLSACNPPPTLSIKTFTPWLLGWGESAFGQGRPLSLPVAGIWNKANFPFQRPGLFTGFWVASRPVYPHTHLSVTTEEGRDAESESAPEGLVEVINQGGQTTE